MSIWRTAVREEIGATDRSLLARAALKWNLNAEGVTTTLVGAHDAAQLHNSLAVLNALEPGEEEARLLARLRTTALFQTGEAQKTEQFFGVA